MVKEDSIFFLRLLVMSVLISFVLFKVVKFMFVLVFDQF